jgi:hypothetical protein
MLHLKRRTQKKKSLVSHVISLSDSTGATKEMFYDISGSNADMDVAPVLDGHVFAVILFAMRTGERLIVHGPLSRSCLYNLEEFQAAWNLWRPSLYFHIDIVPSEVIDLPIQKTGRKALAAFSGGVDSTFTVLRHKMNLCGNASYNLSDILFVHGFDIKTFNTDHFQLAVERARGFIERLGLNMWFVKTNSRELQLADWEDSCGAELACCLHLFSSKFEFGLIGSSGPYDELVLPWGSNPATDHLLSGDSLRCVHDGAGFSRTAKVSTLCEYDFSIKQLRVCLEGAKQFKNCGRCEKCVRTRMNFLASGYTGVPPCFDGPLDLTNISNMIISSDAQLTELTSISEFAKRKGLRGEWLDALDRRIAQYAPPGQLQGALGVIKRKTKRTLSVALDRIGLLRPLWRVVKRLTG